jgi:hypothetical protein
MGSSEFDMSLFGSSNMVDNTALWCALLSHFDSSPVRLIACFRALANRKVIKISAHNSTSSTQFIDHKQRHE